MYEKIKGLVIDIVKHNDAHNVITLYTRSRGRLSFISSAGTGRIARMRNARLQPLADIEFELNFTPSRTLQRLSSFSLSKVWRRIYADPSRMMLALFISDFLNRYLHDAAPEPAVFDFIEGSLAVLDDAECDVSNFHIVFLMQFMHHAGIAPDFTDFRQGQYFDLRGGVCTDARPLHRDWLSSSDTVILSMLMRLNYRNSRCFRLTGEQRSIILDRILYYYSIFFPGVDKLKSLDVLRTLFR